MIGTTKHYGFEIFGQYEMFSLDGINRNSQNIDSEIVNERTNRINSDNLIRQMITPISNEYIDSIMENL